MDIQEFQNKLSGLTALAEKQDHTLTQEEMRECFAGDDLDTEQMLRILTYLKGKGIHIEEEGSAEIADESIEMPAGTPAELTPEEAAYLQEILEELGEPAPAETGLFERLVRGDEEALALLTRSYMPLAARTAAEMNCEEVLLADLVQEANLSLFTALSALRQDPEGAPEDPEAWIRAHIRQGLRAVIEEQTIQKQRDDSLVQRVEKLDKAVRDLSEDEEDKRLPFTLAELAVILDTTEEEIRDVLRLTGDTEE